MEDTLLELGLKFSLPLQTRPTQSTRDYDGFEWLLLFRLHTDLFSKRFLELLVFGKNIVGLPSKTTCP